MALPKSGQAAYWKRDPTSAKPILDQSKIMAEVYEEQSQTWVPALCHWVLDRHLDTNRLPELVLESDDGLRGRLLGNEVIFGIYGVNLVDVYLYEDFPFHLHRAYTQAGSNIRHLNSQRKTRQVGKRREVVKTRLADM
jgi:hypothetical protein